ncbi:hypothetical protein NQ317_011292 [Molorchus minor]|uniref:Alpha-mannosidase n=1 Tax=Molorchus minor TaxID=1323400 RepID=A0ABQ9JV10_9CUCU|nr:hypothetical protein NQ317_011292 [Molorchus minor]
MSLWKLGIIFIIPVLYGVPLSSKERETVCGYGSCHTVDDNKINVHLVPHSHDDVGWLKTVDQYYYYEVQYILSSVVAALLENPDRRFIQVETAYFYTWWNQQTDLIKSEVRQLVNEGRLEIVNGAWSMNDEAAVHYQCTIDQYTLGLRVIEDALGKCARPRVGWQIDPFGHSREQASLLSQFGMDAIFFARLDYRDRAKRQNDRSMDMLWRGSANLGSGSTIFASALYHQYNCPSDFCFDIHCNDPPIIIDKDSPEYNWEDRVNEFVNFVREQSQLYPTNHILITLGDDFQYQAAHNDFINIDRLIEGFKVFNPTMDGKELNVIYSTPSCYTKAVRDYVEAKNLTLDLKLDDFFPFSYTPNSVFTGYFTSRPTSKRLERFANNLQQVTKQLTALSGDSYSYNNTLGQAIGVMQHHDAITGTEKEAVEKDYHRSIVKGMNEAHPHINSAFSSLIGMTDSLNLKSCLLSNVSICSESDKDEFSILIYNPLARNTSHYIQVPVNDGTWKITDPSGTKYNEFYFTDIKQVLSTGGEIENQLTDPIRNFDYITKDTGEKVLDKVLIFRAENLPALGYKVYKFQRISSESSFHFSELGIAGPIGFSDRYITFNQDNGLLKSITLHNTTLDVTQQLMFYKSCSGISDAYVFRPDVDERDAIELGNVTNTVFVNDGNLIREVKQVWNDWATQIIRLYKEEDFIEFDWLVGPIDVSDDIGKEVITRYSTELNTGGVFYTDSNGREIIYRKKDYRPTYEYTEEEPQAGNYYPVNTKIFVKDDERRFSVITDRSEGGSSMNSGEIELMLNRNLLHTEEGVTGENLNETEYGQFLVARGSHFVTVGEPTTGNSGRSMAAIERDIAQRKFLQPWVFYTTDQVSVKEQSFLNAELPVNRTGLKKKNKILIRLEHILEKNEDPELSKQVTVDISDLFKTIKIVSMEEFTLGANTPLEENERLVWPQIADTEDKSGSFE